MVPAQRPFEKTGEFGVTIGHEPHCLFALYRERRDDIPQNEKSLVDVDVDTLLESLSRHPRFFDPFGTGQIDEMELGSLRCNFLRGLAVIFERGESLLDTNRHDRVGAGGFGVHVGRTRDTSKRTLCKTEQGFFGAVDDDFRDVYDLRFDTVPSVPYE